MTSRHRAAVTGRALQAPRIVAAPAEILVETVLAPGEAAEFDTRVLHWFGAAQPGPADVLALLGNQGERTHLRATAKPVEPA